MDFKEFKLSDLANMKYGKMLAKTKFTETGFPVYSGYRITGYTTEFLYKKPMVVVVARGVGGTGDVKISPPESWVTNLSIVLDTDEELVDKYYLYCLLNRENLKAKLDSGASISQITIANLEPYKIRLPHIEYQKKVTSIVKIYDNLIENNSRRISILEDMAQSLYREWFVKFQFPDYESCQFTDSMLGRIPEGWEVKPLINVLEIIIDYRGKTPKKLGGDWVKNGIKALSALNVKRGGLIRLNACKQVDSDIYEKWMKVKLKENDILLTSEAPLGEVAILKGETEYCLSQRLFALRVNQDEVTPEYIFLALFSGHVVGQLLSRATGSTVAGIRQALLKEVPIIVPSAALMKDFTSATIPMLEQISVLRQKNSNLKYQRDMLLPKLISGKINLNE